MLLAAQFGAAHVLEVGDFAANVRGQDNVAKLLRLNEPPEGARVVLEIPAPLGTGGWPILSGRHLNILLP